MEKFKESKAAYYANKLAVESEPGLTTAQLMLFNHDLKPVEPERRQWGPWNFVGFWIGMLCFRILFRYAVHCLSVVLHTELAPLH